jgi:NADH:ubiquinone oxidoreductase subunit E
MVGTAMAKRDCAVILSQFANNKRNLLPILQQVQDELGYIPEKAVEDISKFLKISENEIFGVASFYKHFKFVETGKCSVKVCMGTACHVRGSVNILDEFRRRLSIEPGQTTPDKLFSLETVNCLGACALGPIAVLDGDYHGQLKVKAIEQLVEKVRSEHSEEGCAGNEQQ